MNFDVFQQIFNSIIDLFSFMGNGFNVVLTACVIVIIIIAIKRGVLV